jgi:two-component system LytT family sensor kinase
MKKSVRIALHAAFWLFFPLSILIINWSGEFGFFNHIFAESQKSFWSVFLESFQFLIEPPDKGADFYSGSNLIGIIFNFYIYIILPVGIFYAAYFNIRPKFLSSGRPDLNWKKLLFILLVPFVITTFFRFFTVRVAFEYPYFLTLTYVFAIPFTFSGIVFKLVENWISKEILIKQNLQSELALLKNQINPHFLFNTLNNIDSLIRSNPEKASETLVKLSDILRYMIYDTNMDKVLLSGEIRHIEDYVDLQKIQFANKDLVSLTRHGNTDQMWIAPMLFIPFVENAFKHCTNKNIQNAISIRFATEGKMLTFECVNVYDKSLKMNKDSSGGVGLKIIKRRLELLYPDRHTLLIQEADDQFKVSLSVNTYEN